MHNKLKEIIKYILSKKEKSKMTNTDMSNLLFLLDWKYVLEKEHTLTKFNWILMEDKKVQASDFNKILRKIKGIQIEYLNDANKTFTITLKEKNKTKLTKNQKVLVDYTIDYLTKSNTSLVDIVKMTYPIFSYNKINNELDLEELSSDYIENVKPQIKHLAATH